ncbi:MAG: ergothioneine biosynthesis protein EgtB [Acidimicrobiia bacterium]|nr:ergothioneine biosynthesis protein EgtB [Acidimicrobiia bacterium]
MIGAPVTIDRAAVRDRFVRMRARTRALFALVDEGAYFDRPIPLRNPIVFYEGHLPAFAVNTLVKKGLGRPGIDGRLEEIFARGIDPATEAAAVARGNPAWPSRETVQQYAVAADRLLTDVISHADLERDDHPLLRRAQALWAVLEHEDMHQETLAYMWHQLPHASKRRPPQYVTAPPRLVSHGPAETRARIPAGSVTMGTDLREAPFAWDNELPPHCVAVDAFTIDVHDVTNRQYLEFVEASGAAPPPFWEREGGHWYQRGMFERVILPDDWPVYVTWADADAYARWRGGRLPTEAEFHRAAFGTPGGGERQYPWGDSLSGRLPANVDFRRWDPEPVGAHPDGASAFGVHDLVGNGWEWTSTPFGPFDGFEPLPSYPEYSMEFFDGDHYVLKGASPATPRTLLRRGFRNWFRPRYPYVYATFRCVES